MDIRSLTLFDNLSNPPRRDTLERADRFVRAASALAARTGIRVQTVRLASQPFARWLPSGADLASACEQIERILGQTGIRYLSFGTCHADVPGTDLSILPQLPDAIAATHDVSFSVTIGSARHGLSLPAVRAAAQVIREVSQAMPDGLGNMRFAALASCPPFTPFFPAAYHGGGRPQFSIALEGASLVVEAFRDAISSDDASERLYRSANVETRRIAEFARVLSKETRVGFGGIDLSTAPGEGADRSFGRAVEMLGVPRFGDAGTLYAIALTTSTLDSVRFPRAGFCGVMIPLMEDCVIAQRCAEGAFTLGDLLQYSAVCGAGLDTVPLPGSITGEELASILMDVGALSVRLSKPLTARLMPMPGKAAGDMTSASAAGVVNTRVLAARGSVAGTLGAP